MFVGEWRIHHGLTQPAVKISPGVLKLRKTHGNGTGREVSSSDFGLCLLTKFFDVCREARRIARELGLVVKVRFIKGGLRDENLV